MKYLVASMLVFGSLMAGVGMVVAHESPENKKSEHAEQPKSEDSAKQADRSDASSGTTVKSAEKVVRSEKEWRKLLTREQYRVLRMKGTERPFRNKYDHHFEPGKYHCAACDQELFASDTKFDSGCGWPAFYATMAGDRVVLTPDLSLGMVRTEVTCARCGSHLGHVFNDAPQTPSGQRYCINSVSLKFVPAESKDEHEAPEAKDRKKSAKSSRENE